MSLEQKRLQLPTKFSDVVVGLTNPGWQTVPAVVQRLRSSDRRAVCWSVERSTCRCRPIGAGDGRRDVAGVRDELAVVYKICCSCIMQCLVDQEGQLELDSLSDWKPVELPQHWCDVVTSTSAGDESRCRVLHRL